MANDACSVWEMSVVPSSKIEKMDASWISLRMTFRTYKARAAIMSFCVRFERRETCGRFFDDFCFLTDSRWSCNVLSYFPRSSTNSREFPLLKLLGFSLSPQKAVPCLARNSYID